jgi:hypothetical protein
MTANFSILSPREKNDKFIVHDATGAAALDFEK